MSEADYYAPGSYKDPSAPWNQSEISEKEFDVTCSQSLSRTATVNTCDYVPGASGVDYEPDGEGGYCTCGWQDPDDTSDTNWKAEYNANGYTTPLELIQMLKGYLEKDLENLDGIVKNTNQDRIFLERKLKHLIKECDCWNDDETEFIVED